MLEIINKVTFWLYDTLGLLIPGGIMFLLLGSMFDIYTGENINYLKKIIMNKNLRPEIITIIFVIVAVSIYILGNIVKVMAQLFYELFECIFNKILFNIIKSLIKFLTKYKFFKKVYFVFLKNEIVKLLKKWGKYIFCFSSDKYKSNNKFMIESVIKSLNNRKNINLEIEWYTLYKIGKLYEENKNIKSFSSTFLAKYTFFRSMSFLFFINAIFAILKNEYLELFKTEILIFWILLFMGWLTFHIKYKNYYTLCGNETLVALYYKEILEKE